MEVGAHNRRVTQQTIVKPINMPVGIGKQPTLFIETSANLGWQKRSAMRLAKNHWAIATNDLYWVHREESIRTGSTPSTIDS